MEIAPPHALPARTRENRTLNFKQRLAYAFPQLALSYTGALVLSWLVVFYIPPQDPGEVLRTPMVSAFAFALLLFAGRVVDAIADPYIGYISDRFESPRGRRLPFILYGTPVMALSFGALWFPPFAPGHIGNVVYLALTMSVFWIAFTTVVAPYVALLPEIATGTKERVKLSSYQAAATLLGMIAGALPGELVSAYPDGINILNIHFTSTLQLAALIGAVSMLLFYLPVFMLKEPSGSSRVKPPPGLWQAMLSAFQNPAFRTLIPVATLSNIGLIMMVTSVPYICSEILARPPGVEGWVQATEGAAWAARFIIIWVVATGCLIPAMNSLVPRFGKKRLMLFSGYGFAMIGLGFGTLGFFPEPALPMLIFVVAMSLPAATLMVLVNPIYADVVDFDEERTGYRREGLFTGALAVFGKLSIGIAGSIVALLIGLDDGDTPIGLMLCGPLAGILLFLGTWLFRKHPIED